MKTDFPQVKADPQLLKRVLINLVTNAVQAMPDGGKLTINAKVNRHRSSSRNRGRHGRWDT